MPDLWDEICSAADAFARANARASRAARKKPTSTPDEERALERALIETLCGGINAHWTNDAQIFIFHHWHCQECNASGEFPNIEPGRLVRRHNSSGTSWICHDPHASISPNLPAEFQHHHHNVAWCPGCIKETNKAQSTLCIDHLLPRRLGSGHHFIAMRMPAHV